MFGVNVLTNHSSAATRPDLRSRIKYKGLLKTENNKEISAFYNKLSDADKKKIDLAVAQMDEGP